MPVIKGLEWTFDTVASTYEKFRPGYVTELYQMLFRYCPISDTSNVVEIGIGGGQATLPVLQTGCKFTAVEYGASFSELCKEKFKDFPSFSVINSKFEEVSFENNAYDLIFSASAFHWIPEEIGYGKVFSMLKSGGVFARFANHPFPDKGNPTLVEEIEELYEKYYNQFHNKKKVAPVEYSEEEAKSRAFLAEKFGFTDIQYALFHRTRTFTAKEYITLLGTYSNHIAIEASIRKRFFYEIEKAILNHGGTFTLYDTIDLELARKE